MAQIKRWWFWVLLSGSAIVYAQTTGDAPVLHEFVKIEPSTVARGKPLLPGENGISDVPRGIVYKDEVLPQPSVTPEASGNQPNVIPDDDTMVPDTETEKAGMLSYEEVFNPAITPHKRNRAFDAVNEETNLFVKNPKLQPIPVIGNTTDPERDLFYGALDLTLIAGQAQPLPSVSPESRILSYKTSPKTSLSFYKDSADNFYVSSEENTSVRLVFLTDAPKDYFNGAFPEATLDDIPTSLIPYVPPQITRRAKKVLAVIGIDEKETNYQRILEPMIQYFNSFNADTFKPRPDGDLYLALSISKKGVCRHRAYAFTVTAQAMGIPARYVFNDAHAWVEVYVPKLGWRRIDLGGASAGLDVSGARGKPIYQPEKKDPLESLRSPSAEATASNRPFGGAGGFDRSTGTRPGPDSGGFGGATAGDDSTLTDTTNSGSATPEAPSESPSSIPPAEPTSPPPSLAAGTIPVTLSLQEATNAVLRGQSIKVQGVASAESGPAKGLRVDIYLERSDTSPVRLGAATTDEQGIFRGEFAVPFDQSPLGNYRITLVTNGNATYAPSSTIQLSQ
jgi:transglutaminase-like putative cysteine protease